MKNRLIAFMVTAVSALALSFSVDVKAEPQPLKTVDLVTILHGAR